MPDGPALRLDWVEAQTLSPNPLNWRRHPEQQKAALREAMGDVGWAGALLFNERTNRIIDGHGRLEIAQPTDLVPVLIGNWTEAQEKKILLTLDPIAKMASLDAERLEALMEEVDLNTDGLSALGDALLADLEQFVGDNEAANAKGVSGEGDTGPKLGSVEFKIVIDCRDEAHQAALLEKLERQKLACRAVIV